MFPETKYGSVDARAEALHSTISSKSMTRDDLVRRPTSGVFSKAPTGSDQMESLIDECRGPECHTKQISNPSNEIEVPTTRNIKGWDLHRIVRSVQKNRVHQ